MIQFGCTPIFDNLCRNLADFHTCFVQFSCSFLKSEKLHIFVCNKKVREVMAIGDVAQILYDII